MVPQAPYGELTAVEQSLVTAVSRGERLDLASSKIDVRDDEMQPQGDSPSCRAYVIRDILRGRLAPDPDPRGLRLEGARITGRLDLENVTTDVNLELTNCLLEEGIFAGDARLASVVLAGCRILHSGDHPALDGTQLTCSALILHRAQVISHSDSGAVCLSSAHVGGQLDCTEAKLRNDSGPALLADSLEVEQGMFLDGVVADGRDASGAVLLAGARINGSFSCTRATLSNDSGPALNADRLKVAEGVSLRELRATGAHDGAVRLSSAQIGSQLDCRGAKLHSGFGPALLADSLEVEQGMFLDGVAATVSDGPGTVLLVGARIGGSLFCTKATLTNDSGPALNADRLKVAEGVSLRELRATGAHDGAVRLSSAQIGSQLDCRGAKLRDDSGPALFADSLQVGQALILADGFSAIGGEGAVAVDLTGAQVGGAFVFGPEELQHEVDPHQRLAVDGLTYAGVPEQISPRDWMRLLRDGTPSYAAQPYQQLAAGYRALGDDRQVRRILMVQRDDQLARTPTSRAERSLGQISRITLGYGYQPVRLVWWLGAVVALSCVLAVALGAHGALAQTDKTATPGRPCTVIQELSVGMDLNLPFGTSLAREDCDLPQKASTAANWLTSTGLVLRVAAWVFAALFAGAIAGAIRKT